MKKQSILEWKIWPWLLVAGGVMIVAAVLFYYLAMNIKEPYPLYWNRWYHCAAINTWGLFAVASLLSGIAIYSFVCSLKHPDLRFIEVFDRIFRSYWVYYILFMLLMVVVSSVYNRIYCQLKDYHGVYFKDFLWDDIMSGVIMAPIKEEAMYRLLPFLVAVIPMAVVKSKRWRIVLGCIFGLMIFCVQMQFGYIHVGFFEVHDAKDIQEVHDMIRIHLFIQGVLGIVCAFTFGMVLYQVVKEIMLRQQHPNKFKAVLPAIPLAYLASCLVQGLYNLQIVLLSQH